MSSTRQRNLVVLVLLGAGAGLAPAQTELWNFDLETSGEDVEWTSKTSVCNTTTRYDASFLIFQVDLTVEFGGISFGPFDVVDQIPIEARSGEASLIGPPPILLFDQPIRVPDPPADASVAGDVMIWIDAAGQGRASVTNVVLGEIEIDLGVPFGTRTVLITAVRIVGQLEVTPVVPGDLDGDGDTDISDLGTLLSNFGLPAGATPADGDIDGDGDVDISDLAALLGSFGASCP